MSEHGSREWIVLRGEGTLDVPAAEALARTLARADAAAPVRIDLTRVREFHDLGVAVLGRAIVARPGEVEVSGLGWHQRRILAYLGIDPGGRERAGAGAA